MIKLFRLKIMIIFLPISLNTGCVAQKNHLIEIVLLSTHNIIELQHEISNNAVCATSRASDQPAHMRSLTRAFASGLKLLTEHHLEFLSINGDCTGLS